MTFRILFWVGLLWALAGCTPERQPSDAEVLDEGAVERFDPMALRLEDPGLIEGRRVWMGTCAECHLTGLGGAPVIGDKSAWEARAMQAIDTLYGHAIDGYYGDVGEMPARGGNEDLSDADVKRAVDFVLHAIDSSKYR